MGFSVKILPTASLDRNTFRKASQLDELYWSKAKSVRIARFEEYLREIMKELQSINFSISDEDFKLAIVVYALGIVGCYASYLQRSSCDCALVFS